jgi:hypothetical protein
MFVTIFAPQGNERFSSAGKKQENDVNFAAVKSVF